MNKLQLKVGKWYKRRDGERVECTELDGSDDDVTYFVGGLWYTKSGEFYTTGEKDAKYELIAEWTDEPEAQDIYSLTTPVGLLDDATRKALEDHGGPYEFFDGWEWRETILAKGAPRVVYRAVRRPQRQTVTTRACFGDAGWFFVVVDLIDGKPDWSTLRKWEDN